MPKDDKTEQPTEKRLKEARDKGQVARSPDLTGAAVVGIGVVVVLISGAKIFSASGQAMQAIFADIGHPQTVASAAGLNGLMRLTATTVVKAVGPIAAACLLVGVTVSIAQVGLRFTPKAITPSFQKINPLSGFKNLFSVSKLFELGKDLAKVAVVGGLVAIALVPDITHLGAAVGTPPAALGILIRSGVQGIAIRAALAYLVIGVVDFAYQKHRMGQSLKMTKQEVKDELRQKDLPPEVKRAIRRRQRQRARARMMAAVPKADVVVVNPTHFAVALQYDGEHPAPIVVAKGRDHVALQIRRIATENEVPIIENPPLARELYATVEIDQMIPQNLYAAVAKVLAFVYRMAARKRVAV
jgi:flagellar biosynthetic protein FlhB